MSKVYITAAGKFFPNDVVNNQQIENYLGKINGVESRTKNIFLRKNGIQSRYYAMDIHQQTTHTVHEMAANAIDDCLQKSTIDSRQVDFLSAATTQGDLPVPGFASMVHGASSLQECGIASHQSVCAAGIMAIQNAYLHVKSGEMKNAVCCAGELASRMFKSQRFQHQSVLKDNNLPVEIDFLRWMLSDGAGAFLLQSTPEPGKTVLEIDWIDIRSYAHQYNVCMYAGGLKNEEGQIDKTWLDYSRVSEADEAGAVNLRQDMELVDNIVKLGVGRFFELIDEKKIDEKNIDWLVCHYSSHHFKQQIVNLLKQGGLEIDEDKWFTNLYTKGNVGSASIFVMLEELLYSNKLKQGQKILCMVPESGRFITGFMQLTVVQEAKKNRPVEDIAEIKAPEIRAGDKPVQEWLVRQLTNVWIDFEISLQQVPVVQKIFSNNLSLESYKRLLVNLRQQVIDGSQWIARAASNVSMEYFPVRSSFIRHSSDEHKDYQLLEKNYINCGGTLEEIVGGQKNIGSEALSAFMFHRASQPDPFDLLGAMFIIEGLGNRVAGKWGRSIREQLELRDDQVSFFLYHESSDSNENHFERFEKAIQSELLTEAMAKKIVKTAKVVARLYRMQLEEIDNF
jgi:3-oxoacyl-[acyl-carrier-protein] synthase-3